MEIKDYYNILGIAPIATEQEIKKAFRRLALQYHPDKNQSDPLAEALFKEVQEAYEVLSDPKQREEYNYKRWYNRSTGTSFVQQPLTPSAILAESRKLKDYVNSMNIFQVDYNALSFHIRQLLSETNQAILLHTGDAAINRSIIKTLISAAAPLPLRYTQPIADTLLQLAAQDNATISAVNSLLKEKKLMAQWEKYQWLVVLLLTALICWLMVAVAG